MIELERHIEILLLDNDCVIVPGFGGFVAHHQAARFDDADNTFLPPMRTLGFNSKLSMNDSLLVQSYVEAYDLSYPEALKRIETEVDELKLALEKEGFFELNDIGTLLLNADGNYEFSPCESGILTPELYGLAGCSVEPLSGNLLPQKSNGAGQKQQAVEPVVAVEPEEPKEKALVASVLGESKLAEVLADEEEEQKEKTIEIRVSVLRQALAVACAVLFFFMLSTPLNTQVAPDGQKISSINGSLLYNLIPKDGSTETTNIEKIAEEARQEAPAAANATAETKAPVLKADEATAEPNEPVAKPNEPIAGPKEEKPAQAASEDAVDDYYCIVLASHITRSNAQSFVDKLHTDGFAEAQLLEKNGRYLKVVYGKYQTEGKAYSALNKLHSNRHFEQGWVLHVK